MIYFYTDFQTEMSRNCLCHLNDVFKAMVYKELIQVDPGVMQLKKSKEYKDFHALHAFVKNIGVPISIDYPCDMNQEHTNLFISKTNVNNKEYALLSNYITTIQYKMHDIESFHENWKINEQYFIGKIVGLGNLCRLMKCDTFTDDVIDTVLHNDKLQNCRRLHIFGPSLRFLQKYLLVLDKLPFIVSFDTTKFTRAVNNDLKKKYGASCHKNNRNIFFIEYINEIEMKTGVKLHW